MRCDPNQLKIEKQMARFEIEPPVGIEHHVSLVFRGCYHWKRSRELILSSASYS